MKRISILVVALVMVFGLSLSAQAALIDKGGGLIYDDLLNITWLWDANYAAMELTDTRVSAIIGAVGSVAGHTLTTSDFYKDASGNYPGYMIWWGAMAWADQLGYQGYGDWRLPTTPGTTSDYVNEGEMGHMYYTSLGNLAGGLLANTGPFTNLQAYEYWSGTEYAAGSNDAWMFGFDDGHQDAGSKDDYGDYGCYAWAVRAGDSAPVPIPGTMLLLGSGLAGLGLYRKRMGRRHG